MPKKRRNKKKRNNNLFKWILIIVGICIIMYILRNPQTTKENPEDTLRIYMSHIINKDYEKMYEMLSNMTKQKVEKETYIARNRNIYEGIEIKDLKINIVKTNNKDNKKEVIYQTTIQTVAGEISFFNTSYFQLEDEKYKLEWSSTDIFPELKDNYKVRVETIQAERGKILDRNGTILAGKQTASQIGLVPRKNE